MLLYVAQGRHNEKYTYDPHSGFLHLADANMCLIASSDAAPSPPPPPPPPPPGPPPPPRTISVTWAELGLPPSSKWDVRDLWAKTELGEHQGSFAAEVKFHEATIFMLNPKND